MLEHTSGGTLLGLGMGLLTGIAAGLLVAPMRGHQLRAALRTRVDQMRERGMALAEHGRGAFNTSLNAPGADTPPALTATLGEIAQTHSGGERTISEARS